MTSVQAWGALRASADSIKENANSRLGLSGQAVLCLSVCWALALLVALRQDAALPAPLPLDAPPTAFSAERAAVHLRNLTALGPRVAGSYENEVAAVAVVRGALHALRGAAGGDVQIDIDVQRADGAFPITFLDGMSNVYRGAQFVVARVSAAGGGRRQAVLLNCHYDTVADSAGAADDAAGCAVLLEAARALLAAGPRRWGRDLLLLLNGAEENIMQAGHAFVSSHPWSARARAVVNLEACGAGGRELLFRAARAARLLPLYAAAPHPYGSSLAHEVFDSGLVPGDTDFRIFRDFGGMAGFDLAWSADGYAYHTALDQAERVPLAALQRTGENVVAIISGMLELETELVDGAEPEMSAVYFDVLGVLLVSCGGRAALLLAALLVLLAACRVQRSAAAAQHLLLTRAAWWRVVLLAARALLLAALAGLAAALLLALLLHAARCRLAWYANPWLLAPLYGGPALAAAVACAARQLRGCGCGALPRWWRARAACDALALLWGAALAACALLRLRSGFVPALWCAACAAPALLPASLRIARTESVWVVWCGLALAPALQTWYLAASALRLLAPVAGRAGQHAPPDALLAALTAAAALAAAAAPLALLPAASARTVRRCVLLLGWCGAAGALLALLLPPYSALRPQRVMLFHVRRTTHHHVPQPHAGSGDSGELARGGDEELMYWLPSLDVNMPHSLYQHVPAMSSAREMSSEECATRLYCGAPYYLPVLSLVSRAHFLPSSEPPRARLLVNLRAEQLDPATRRFHVNLTGPAHTVVIVSPARGAALAHTSLLARAQGGPRWGGRDTYLLALGAPGAGGRPARWHFTLTFVRGGADGASKDGGAKDGAAAGWASLSLAGHAMFGADQRSEEHDELRDTFPPWTQVTGWGVDLHLIDV